MGNVATYILPGETMRFCRIAICLLLAGCAETTPRLTWPYMLEHQTSTYINSDGKEAWAVRCVNPTVCLQLQGMRCPHGYTVLHSSTEVEHVQQTRLDWSQWGGNGGSSSHDNRITYTDIVCKPGPIIIHD